MAENPDYKPVSSKAAQTARYGRAIFFHDQQKQPLRASPSGAQASRRGR